MLFAMIMAGGAGTRFWPASRVDRPKQLLDFGSGRTMLQQAVDRLGSLVDPKTNVLIVTNERLVKPIREQFPALAADRVVGEPCKRDTAPAVGLGAALVMHHDPDAIMLVTPADHVISPDEKFQAAVRRGVALVEKSPERIVTFGIKPTYPAATFGYIERESQPLDPATPPAWQVTRFREKPSAAVAAEYIAAGNFFWNAGIFIWKAKTVWDAIAKHEPAMHAHLQAIADAIGKPNYDEVFRHEFTAITGKSIDYAVMEHHKDVAVIEAPFNWDDLGNWPSLARTQGVDAQGNTVVGKHIGVDTQGCIIRSEGNHLITTLGLTDVIVVHTPEATLVANKRDEESVRKLVKLLEEKGWKEYL